MAGEIDQILTGALENGSCHIGQIAIRKTENGFALRHRDDAGRADLQTFGRAEEAQRLARFDDNGAYRPLRTAPNLRHGWEIQVSNREAVGGALEYFYPGRLGILTLWKRARLQTTSLRQTLGRQSGMYRIAANIADDELDEVVGRFCRSDGGCLRTILWKRDEMGGRPSSRLPADKFDPAFDQTGAAEQTIPLLCQEGCHLLVNECRKAVKDHSRVP